MNSFLKTFLACFLAVLLFSVMSFFILIGYLTGLATKTKERTGAKAVLVVDLAHVYPEISVQNPLTGFGEEQYDVPALYDVVRMIKHAKGDSAVKGIYLKCGMNMNGFGSSEEIRNALVDFKSSGKFIYAYADVISQSAYHVANVSTKIYCSPQGGVDWRGMSMKLFFMKDMLDRLDIEPQIFYAGKFKSATEPFREQKMTEPNRIQSSALLNDLYGHFLSLTAETRKIDTATLHRYANENLIQFASDALRYGLVDGLKYDDEVKEEIKGLVKVDRIDAINFVPLGKYASAAGYKREGKDKVAVIYAQGDIIDGKGDQDMIGSETYRNLVRKARLDKTVKAIVFRINSGGGSAMASENIWRELSLAKKDKPVVISFGDVSASGGYYLSCNADSIFAQPNTITGSIGVFTLLPNMQDFFKNKLGVTFDGVKTSPDADILSITKPLTESQRKYFQREVDSIYHTFKSRVADGRKKSIEYIDSIGQGRVWSGTRGLELGLVDRIGGLQDAVECAARMAKVTDYRLREYPDPKSILDLLFGSYGQNTKAKVIKEELGEEGMRTYQTIRRVKRLLGVSQARIPFDFTIE
jgi:protease IV